MQTIKRLPRWGVLALLAYMPFHIFLAQWLGTSFGALDTWKIAKDVFGLALFLLTGALVLFTVRYGRWRKYRLFIILTAVYALLHIILYLANKRTPPDVAALAATYNNRFVWVFLVGLGSGLLTRKRIGQAKLIKFVLIISTIVCLLGLAQWFLPRDILTHFGYDKALGVKPNFFINEDPAYPRVFATLRDPNSLGAYLLVPILLLVQQIGKVKRKRLVGAVLGLHLIVLYLSFSRAAWGGLLMALAAYFVLSHRQKSAELLRKLWPLVIVAVLISGFALYAVKDTRQFRSIVLKADDNNAAHELDSDEYHLKFIKEGLEGIVDKPLGHGPGTAGIVSIHNGAAGQLTENYYIQIGYEVGVIGLMVFVAIWALAVQMVWRAKTEISVPVVAAAAGLAVVALAMHLWTNEAVAYTWWGLAGLTITYNVQGSTLYMRREERRAK